MKLNAWYKKVYGWTGLLIVLALYAITLSVPRGTWRNAFVVATTLVVLLWAINEISYDS